MAVSARCLQGQTRGRLQIHLEWHSIVRRIRSTIQSWSERSNQRKVLLALDDRLLNDIGISRADAEQEGAKPFWRD